MEEIVNQVTKVVSKSFPKVRIICLLFFGTRAYGINTSNRSDYDFLLLLDKYRPGDTLTLRKISQRKTIKNIDFNFNFLYLSDLLARGKDKFQLRSLHTNFYDYLKHAIVLLGENVFAVDPVKVSRPVLTKEMDEKIQEYCGRCDKLFVQNLEPRDLYYKLVKYVSDIIRFMVIRERAMTIKQLAEFDYGQCFRLLPKAKYSSLA